MRSPLLHGLAVVALALGISGTSLGAEHSQAPKATTKQNSAKVKMTPELKRDMANMYQKMADCMRTDRSVEECSQEAMKDCPVVEKTGHCPINEGTSPMTSKQMGHSMGGMPDMDMGQMKSQHPTDGKE